MSFCTEISVLKKGVRKMLFWMFPILMFFVGVTLIAYQGYARETGKISILPKTIYQIIYWSAVVGVALPLSIWIFQRIV